MMKPPRPLRLLPEYTTPPPWPPAPTLDLWRASPAKYGSILMAIPAQAGSSGPAPSLSGQDRFLIEESEQAIRDGKQLDEWIRAQFRNRALRLFPLDLKRTYRVPNRAEGFLDTVSINGEPRFVMGCVQTVQLGEEADDNDAAPLADSAHRDLSNRQP